MSKPPFFLILFLTLFLSVLNLSSLMASEMSLDSLLKNSEKYLYSNQDSALHYLAIAAPLANESGDENKIGWVANYYGTVYYVGGNYAESMRHYSKANEIFDRTQEKAGLSYALNGRGLIYMSQNDLERSIDIFNRCIRINRSINDTYALGRNYFNRSIAEADLKQFDQAHQSIDSALSFLEQHPDRVLYSMTLNRAGKIYFDEGKLTESEAFYRKVLNHPKAITNWAKTFAYSGLAEIELAKGNPQQALEYALTSEEYANKSKGFWDNGRVSRILAEVYEELGNNAKALHFAKKYKAFSDSLYNENKNAQISYLQLQLANSDNQSLKHEMELTENSAAFNRKFTIVLSISILILLLALVLYGKLLKQKEKINKELLEKQQEIQTQNQKLENINEEKNKLFSILSHDLKAPINSIKQLLELEEHGALDPEEQVNARKLLIKQVANTDDMLRKLLRWSHAQLDGILTNRSETDLHEIVDEQVSQMDYQILSKNIKIETSFAAESTWILVDLQQLRIILQNCLQNAIKFSNPNDTIRIWVREDQNNAHLHIQDEGIGISQEKLKEIFSESVRVNSTIGTHKEQGTGLGLFLIRQFMDKNQGTIQINSEIGKGTEIILSFEKVQKPELSQN
ncbi:tetratricopeptide repeat-containing sensor histidine kinase [Algoriphagus vanfongensis]|uniref:tetratricopeptide repeat-containing sensor histidine kinase n=1 Tax=Algoriphagus vanfongensis TaxID=426371 RepID=UPI0003FF4E75|nr:HAMP domain-containing sensor histidine kinase [Algoriphagus vanfongensis]